MFYIFATNEEEAEEQFQKKLQERGWNVESVVFAYPFDSYTTKENAAKVKKIFEDKHRNIEELKKNRPEFVRGLRYEINNYEYCCSFDEEQTTREVLECFYIKEPTPYEEECFKEALSKYMEAVFQ